MNTNVIKINEVDSASYAVNYTLSELQGITGLKALRVGVNYLSCDFYDEQWIKHNKAFSKKVKQV